MKTQEIIELLLSKVNEKDRRIDVLECINEGLQEENVSLKAKLASYEAAEESQRVANKVKFLFQQPANLRTKYDTSRRSLRGKSRNDPKDRRT